MRAYEILNENEVPWNKNPTIGWWLDNDPVTFYHGTHSRNLAGILEGGIYAPKEGSTAGWVSLALEPHTGHAYAAMSGKGGETQFRAAGADVITTPHKERVTFILQIPQSYFLPKMAPARGAREDIRDKLTNKERYLEWAATGKTDQEYYQITEIRLPKLVPADFIVGHTFKG